MSKGSAIFGWARLLAPIILANIPQTRALAPVVAQGMDDAEAIHDAPGAAKLQHVIALSHDAADGINAQRPGTVNKDQLDVAIASGVNAAFAAAQVIAAQHGHPQADDVTLASQLAQSGYSAAPGTESRKPGEPIVLPKGEPAAEHPAPGGDAVLRTDGPTLEEYTAKGYNAAGYPPKGYAAVPSAGLTSYRKAQAAADVKQPIQQPPGGAPRDVATESAGASGTAVEAPAGAGSGTHQATPGEPLGSPQDALPGTVAAGAGAAVDNPLAGDDALSPPAGSTPSK